jgi:hypothetical protein
MPWKWISSDKAFSVKDLPTRYGQLDFSIHANSETTIRVKIGALASFPPGGLTLVPPLPESQRIVALEIQKGTAAPIDQAGMSIVIKSLPFTADLRLGSGIEAVGATIHVS